MEEKTIFKNPKIYPKIDFLTSAPTKLKTICGLIIKKILYLGVQFLIKL